MQFEIELTREAEIDLDCLAVYYRQQVMDGMERYLPYTPTRESRSRIKRLQLLDSPAYRLRINDYRVFYDIDETTTTVTVLRILSKEESLIYLADLESET